MNSTTNELIGLQYSPWTQKARWALDHHRVPYQYHEHVVLLGMPQLRWKTGKWSEPLTVPAFRSGKQVLIESWEIARHADSLSNGAMLFPEELLGEIGICNALSEKALGVLRALVLLRMGRDRAARAEALPPWVPQVMRGAFSGVASLGLSYIQSEFAVEGKSEEQREAELETVLKEIRQRLTTGGGEYILRGRFTYADIALTVALQGVEPASDQYVPMGPAMRRSWATPRLATQFADLVQWRDRIFSRHHPHSKAK